MIDYGEFIALAAVETSRRVMLSANSITLFQSGFQWFRNMREWEDDTDPLSELEEDVVDALVALAFEELLENTVDLGTIFPFVTASPPTNSLECDGTHYLRTDYPALYAALDAAYIVDADHFKTPDLRGRVPLGVGTGSGLSTYATGDTGGEEKHLLTTSELTEHNHAVIDGGHAHGVSDPTHNHTLTDPTHNHTLNNPTHSHTLTDPGHVHAVTDPGHVHVQGNGRGTAAGAYQSGTNSGNFTTPNTNSATTGVTVDSHTTGVTANAAAAGQTAVAASTGITQAAASTGVTVQEHVSAISIADTGSSQKHENRQPYLALRFALWAK